METNKNEGNGNKVATPQKEQLTMAGNQRKQGRSTSYALKAFSGHLETLSEENLITPAEAETIKKIHKNATIMYMQKELGVMLD